jgi:hypothetical protein
MQMTPFLKRVLLLDAASCLGMAALLIPGANLLSGPLGLSPTLLMAAGLILIPCGLFMSWVATRKVTSSLFVWIVILGNFAWVAKSLVVAFVLAGITALGIAFVLAQAAAVLVLAILERVGLRRALIGGAVASMM